MLKLRDIFIFLAGAAFLHTISHIVLPYYINLPMDAGFMIVTKSTNNWIIIISALITIILLWFASRLNK